MSKQTYKEYLNSSEWKKKRQKVLERDDYFCQDCFTEAEEIHHETYENLFDEPLEDLVALCSRCHRDRHKDKKHGGVKKDLCETTCIGLNETDSGTPYFYWAAGDGCDLCGGRQAELWYIHGDVAVQCFRCHHLEIRETRPPLHKLEARERPADATTTGRS